MTGRAHGNRERPAQARNSPEGIEIHVGNADTRRMHLPMPAAGGPGAEHGAGLRRDDLGPDSVDWGIMLRSLMAIWGVGATFFLVIFIASPPPLAAAGRLLGIDVIGFALLGMLYAGRERLPRWTPDVCAYVLYLAVGGIILIYQDIDSPYGLFYLWLSVHSFYFLPWKRAAPQVAFIAADYAVCLLVIPGRDFPIMRWTITVLTTGVTCTMVALLRARVNALVDRLSDAACADPLTGLRNRRAYDEVVAQEMARAERNGQSFALVLGDIDHFKRVNDQFGHPAGDDVLRRVSAQLRHSARKVDVAARLGGEEFALVLPNTNAFGAYVVAERTRRNLRAAFLGEPTAVTMSFGLACYPTDAGDAEALFAAADLALLRAKREGRDRSVVYSRIGGEPAAPR
jgi:diguanylate cyclase (GGDEF)-like protein